MTTPGVTGQDEGGGLFGGIGDLFGNLLGGGLGGGLGSILGIGGGIGSILLLSMLMGGGRGGLLGGGFGKILQYAIAPMSILTKNPMLLMALGTPLPAILMSKVLAPSRPRRRRRYARRRR